MPKAAFCFHGIRVLLAGIASLINRRLFLAFMITPRGARDMRLARRSHSIINGIRNCPAARRLFSQQIQFANMRREFVLDRFDQAIE
jgi:hypothetical protein